MSTLDNSVLEHLSQSLTVPVELPEVKVLHKAQLHLFNETVLTQASSICGSQGQAILAELSIEQSRQWAHEPTHDTSWEFHFEVHADPDAWLVGGQRSGRFSAKASRLCIWPKFLD